MSSPSSTAIRHTPVERAILAGDQLTGVCLMAVEEGLDTGGVYGQVDLAIGPDESAEELRARLVAAGSDLLVEQLRAGLGPAAPQVGEATYAEKLRPDELEIDWGRSALSVHRLVRVGGAWTTFRGRRLKVWVTRVAGPGVDLLPGRIDGLTVGTGAGGIELVEVQPEGKGRQAAGAWRNGAQPGPADRFGLADGLGR